MRRPLAVIMAVRMIVMMVMIMSVLVIVMLVMIMPVDVLVIVLPVVIMRLPVDPGFAFTASAYATHYSASISLIRISSPAVNSS